MGGAYTAMSGDSSATGFYNPAALVEIKGTDISASATLFNKYDTTYGKGQNILQAGERVNRGFFRTVPSAIGNAYRWKNWGFGFSIVVPDYDFFSGNISSSSTGDSFLTYTDENLWSGGVLSYKINDKHNIGISLYYTARSLIRSTQDRSILSPTHEIITTEEKSLKQNSLLMILGYLWKINPRWSMGVSARPPALQISGQGSYYKSVTDTNNLPSQITEQKNLRARTYIPPRYTLGFAYHPSERLTLAFDGSFYTGFGYRDMGVNTEASDHIQYVDTWNASLGMEYKFKWPKVNWRLGVFTNNPSVAKIPTQPTERQGDYMKMYGFASNIKFLITENSSYTVGGFYTGGQGYSVQQAGNQLVRLDKTHHIFSLLISSAYKF